MPLSQLNTFQHTNYDPQLPKLTRQQSTSSSVAFPQQPASVRSSSSTASSFLAKTISSFSHKPWTRPRLKSLSKTSSYSIRRIQSQTNERDGSFEVIGSEYVPLSAEEELEHELKRSRSVLSLAVSHHQGGTQEERIRKLDAMDCSVGEYWAARALIERSGESPEERNERETWERERAKSTTPKREGRRRQRMEREWRGEGRGSARGNGWGGEDEDEGQTWEELITWEEKKERDEITRLGTVMEVVTIDELDESKMRMLGLKIREPLPNMPFSKLSKPITPSVIVVPSQASMFDHRPKLVPSSSFSSSSSRLAAGHNRSVTPPPMESFPSFTSATFDSSPEMSSADPTPQTPSVATFPSNQHTTNPSIPTWSVSADPEEEQDQEEEESFSIELPPTGGEDLERPIWKKEKQRRLESTVDDSFDSNASPSKFYGYPDSVLDHYAASSEGGSPFVSPIKSGSKVESSSPPFESPPQQSFLSYSTHPPLSPNHVLASPTPSEQARYLDRSISPSDEILEARRIEALDDPSPSRSHVTSTSEDSEDPNNFASIHLAVRGTPTPSAFVPISTFQPTQTPSTRELEEDASPLPTPGQAWRSVARSIGLPLNPSDYSNSPSNRDGSFNFQTSSEASPTPGVAPFDASFNDFHQRVQMELRNKIDDSLDSSLSSGVADIEEVDKIVGGRGKERMKSRDTSWLRRRRNPTALVKKSSMPSISSPLAKGSGNIASPAPSSLSSNSPSSLHHSPAFTPLPATFKSTEAQRFERRYVADRNKPTAAPTSPPKNRGDESFESGEMESGPGRDIMRSVRKARGVRVSKGGRKDVQG